MDGAFDVTAVHDRCLRVTTANVQTDAEEMPRR